MGQFSAEKPVPPGSTLSGNQQAERESDVKPNGMPDDRRRELVAGKRDRHPLPYPSTGPAPRFV